MSRSPGAAYRSVGRAMSVFAGAGLIQIAVTAADVGAPESIAAFLALKEIAVADRAALDDGGPWTDEKDRLLVRVLARLPAPEPLAGRWRAAAEPIAPRGEPQAVKDRLVRVRGRAIRVAPRDLPAEIARLAGWPRHLVVRIVDERGGVVDVVTRRAPAAWPMWREIDEPAEVVGLPLASAAGPLPVPSAGEAAWPAAPPNLLLAATDVVWRPDTMLGRLGVDYGLFDAILDDRRLEPADAPAFWAVLGAAAGARPAEIVRAAGGTDVLDLIDPARKWFATRRGDPVVIDGVARRATRIAIDEPACRSAVGRDHYWEVEVFADTPTIKVNDRIQDRYPIVCCVAILPAGMPTGESISELVRVSGFGFKRYRYPLAAAAASPVKADRISTALVIAPTLAWRRPPGTEAASSILVAAAAVILGLLTLAAALAAWRAWGAAHRSARTRRATLPDRIRLRGE